MKIKIIIIYCKINKENYLIIELTNLITIKEIYTILKTKILI